MHTPPLKNRRGFTIIETLVAIAIIMIVLAGPLATAYRGLATAQISKDQLMAAYIAQDAVEYIHYVRDTNISEEKDFDLYLSNCTLASPCIIDTTDEDFSKAISPANSTNRDLYINVHDSRGRCNETDSSGKCTGTGLWGPKSRPSDIKTNFTRIFYMRAITPPEKFEYQVTVIVTWVNGKTSDSFTLTDNILTR